MSQLAFLLTEFPDVYDSAHRAEVLANSDPRAACFYARRALELAVGWVFEHDSTLQLPYRDDLSALIHEATFRNTAGQAIFQKCKAIKDLGNLAVHSPKPLNVSEAGGAVRELFYVCYWLARTYAKGAKPEPGTTFDPSLLPVTTTVPRQTIAQLQKLSEELTAQREKLFAALADKENLDEELKRLRAELVQIKRENEKGFGDPDYNEAQTRDLFIDLYLKEAGWALGKPEDREYEVAGMPNSQNKGFVDYVLWGDNGLPLAVVEAKRTKRDAKVGLNQARLYAECLEAKFGQRPVIFCTNGYEHWIWDDQMYPQRQVQGFYTKSELELLIQRRKTRRSLLTAKINEKIVERYYQTRAIRKVGEAFEKDHARKALLVMATGSGKTRTVIALVDMLMKANWAKRVLFLADRTALVNQAVKAFKDHLPDAAPVNLVTEKNTEGRVYVSTYPTMIGLIDEGKGAERKFGPGHFDLIIIDEAHRSVFMKYRSIFDYFDSHLVGLTATPKDEVDRNTYGLFELEDGVPTDAYPLDSAVADKFLVPAKSVSVPLKLPTQGLTYDLMSEADKEQFELTDWKERSEDVLQAGRVEAAAVNQWLFNQDTVDKALKHLMERGLKVDGGDKLGKTIIFAKNHKHAEFIAERFNANYPKYAGHFAQVIDFQTEYPQALIDSFSNPSKLPQIAISVDMLDTGIDVPEVVNLVFFKEVRSKTKFWQMVGRGTRLCPDLFGPGQDKQEFYIFDFCGNLEFFSQEMVGTDGSSGASLGQRLFAARLKLLTAMLKTKDGATAIRETVKGYAESEPETSEDVFKSIIELLKFEVGSMNTDNFIVRAKRRLVEKYQNPEQWLLLDDEKISELEAKIAGLPSEKEAEPVEAKQFDLLMLRLQLSTLKGTPGFKRLKQQIMDLAATLEESKSIPVIGAQLSLIQDLQSEGWWDDVSVPMLEVVRLRLRSLMRLVEHKKGSPVYANFEEEVGEETEIVLPGFVDSNSFERFKEKARVFLRNHLDARAVQKLRQNIALSSSDLEELESLLREPAANDPDLLIKASQNSLGLFVRSLVGMDRTAAQTALSGAISSMSLSPSQIEFVTMLIDHIAEHGYVDDGVLYESPYTDISPNGPERLFSSDMLDKIFGALDEVRSTARI